MNIRKLTSILSVSKHIFICINILLFYGVSLSFANQVKKTGVTSSISKNIKIKITGENNEKNPVHLTLASKNSEIVGAFSITTMNLIVSNESDRILEGELEFPLEEDETVIGYAIDVNGRLRNGVVVEKEKGRQVFEAVVRQGIDPGLIEKTVGNNFKTRIYPIPARGIRQIQIVVQTPVKSSEFRESTFIQTLGKNTYFYYTKPLFTVQKPKNLPKNLVVWWDISGSGVSRNLSSEIELLKAYIKKLDNPDVTIVPFEHEIHNPSVFKGKSGEVAEKISEFLKTLEYDGATNLGIEFEKLYPGDEILIFTDGIANWGNENIQSKNVKFIHAGENVNLENELNNLLFDSLRLIRVEYDEKAVSDIFPKEGSVVSSKFALTGILKKKNAEVKLYFGYGNSVEQTYTVKLSSLGENESEYVSRQWAVEKIDFLSSEYNKNRAEIIELAKKFSIVTKDTSLIVLDSANDYVRYGIIPPETDRELRSEYNKIIAHKGNSVIKHFDMSLEKKIPDSVYRIFKEFKSWWNTSLEDFKKKKENGKVYAASIREISENEAEVDYVLEDSVSLQTVNREWTGTGFNQESLQETRSQKTLARSLKENHSKLKTASIQLQAWNPNSDYIAVLKKTPLEKMWKKYLELKKDYGASPSFYMEVSDYFDEEGLKKESVRILSNLAELNLENTDVLRALANKLMERKFYSFAVPVFEKLVALKSEVPQFLRDLGMAYYLNGELQKSVDTLYSVAYKEWDLRFDEVQQIALNDMNAIIAECERNKTKIDINEIDKKLIENFDVDVRVILTWNTDDCDVDLWVTDSDEEKCYYGNRITRNGGRMSRDFTQGYGPEEFCIKKSPKGKLKIEANYFGNHQQKMLQPVSVQVEVYTNFGRKNQKREVLTLQLDDIKGTFLIGEVEV